MKRNILFIMPLPPPVHGSSMMSYYIKNSKTINTSFNCDYINISTSRKNDDIGKMKITKVLYFIASFFSLLSKLMIKRYDLCYFAITCYGIGFIKDAPFVLLCKLFRRKIVIHHHNKGMSKYVNKHIYRWLFNMVYKNSKVILLSWKLYSDISEIVKEDQVYICPNGIPKSHFFIDKPKEEREVIRLLFLSNLAISKGVFILLDSLEKLKNKGYKFVCDFVGSETKDISEEKFKEEVRKHKLENFVIFNNRKLGQEKEYFLYKADILIQPTFEDCFPLTLIEAMQYSLPIITTNEGAIEDIVEHLFNGLICKTKDENDLLMNIEKLINDDKLRRILGNQGYKKYTENFTQNIFENNLCRILKDNSN